MEKHMFKVHGMDVVAYNTLDTRFYYIDDDIIKNEIRKNIPANIKDIDDIEKIKDIHKKIMHIMNVAWSSSNGVPTFPEKYGKKTRLSRGDYGTVFTGQGWYFCIFYDHKKYKDDTKILMDEVIRISDEEPLDEHYTDKIKKETSKIVSMLGKLEPVA